MEAQVTAATDTTEVAKRLVCAHLQPGDLAVDATCGNGWDTLALAEAVGPDGRVIAFDVQAEAIAATRECLGQHLDRVTLIQASHVNLADHLTGKAQAIMFNLGYLPGGDKALTTRTDETLPALQLALDGLDTHGLLSIVVYPGHPEGLEEAKAIDTWVAELKDLRIFSYKRSNSRAPAPYAWFIQTGKK
jgi:methylase of polypeptide subunit release factors